MSTTTPNPPHSARPTGLRLLWFGAVAAQLAWSAHLLVGYWIATAGCASHASVVDLALHLLTLVAIAVAAAAGAAGWQNWHAVERAAGHAARTRFMGQGAVLLASLFLLAIAFGELPVLLLPTCG